MKKRRNDRPYEVPAPKAFEEATPNVVGRRGEKNLKRTTGCVLTPGSGAGSMKGDGLHDFKRMMEKKSTAGKTMTVRRADIEKLMEQAWAANREPVFVLEFEAMKFGSQQWGMVPLERLMELFEIEEKMHQKP